MINLVSIYSSNIVGLLVMAVILLSRGWRIQNKNSESLILLVMIFSVISGCIVDPLVFYFDGKPGTFVRIFLYIGNSFLFFLNAVIGPAYITIIVRHINESQSCRQRLIVYSLCLSEILLLLINLFKPLVFLIDENNCYRRLSFYGVYIIVEAFFLLYGLYEYFAAKRRGRILSFFPTWQFLVPIAVGMLVQTALYGVSLIWPCVGVSVCCIALSLQNENIYLDKLTGAFNRFYLNEIVNAAKKRGEKLSALMLDMNGFKQINDNYSHTEGDNALIAMADILNQVVMNNGVVIRFAGDEFIVILDKTATHSIVDYKEFIADAIEDYNDASKKPYKLSAAIGGDIIDLSTDENIDLISEIDKHMYADKEEYYKKNNRRKR
ncbi:GGDEF domain-containing protein [Butyrivibrio sp. AD3002]|uniref:GGDEF domain-containing protein n=1 Tax=Butyrivibrio sp. AD3002 TaxID=1280670 RepID=UPI0003B5D46E|nr:GGDEF domain-containing protein [Butyrivibrio sp. AD3002]